MVGPTMIYLLGERALEPLNFAACWNDESTPGTWVGVETTVSALDMVVPPILYSKSANTYHLMLDFFRNSWMVSQRQQEVPVPSIRGNAMQVYEEGPDEQPWIERANELAEARPETKSADLWWADDTPLLRELYSDD